jgi:hypothetical protein
MTDDEFKAAAVEAVKRIPIGEWSLGGAGPDPRCGGILPKIGAVQARTSGGAVAEMYHTGGPIEPVGFYLDVEGIEVAKAERYSAEYGAGGRIQINGDSWVIELYRDVLESVSGKEKQNKLDQARRKL